MVAYNFKSQFSPLVEQGRKRQTLRLPRKSRHARPGEPIQLYTGMRTNNCRKLIDPDPVCKEVCQVGLSYHTIHRPITGHALEESIFINGTLLELEEAYEFAKADGFTGVCQMFEFFNLIYGYQRHRKLVLIRW